MSVCACADQEVVNNKDVSQTKTLKTILTSFRHNPNKFPSIKFHPEVKWFS